MPNQRLPVLQDALARHVRQVSACTTCAGVVGPAVAPPPVVSRVYLVGQAPGPHESRFGRPFAWTAGKTLFRWFESLGIDEPTFRARAYMAAVCRCFPGKASGGGDRVPSPAEVESCSRWIRRELALLAPTLIVPVGKLAITEVLGDVGRQPLAELVGRGFPVTFHGHAAEAVPLPHPSGASTWFKMEPGKTLLPRALGLLGAHPAWREAFGR
jgi:uracil-DNA glycosylase